MLAMANEGLATMLRVQQYVNTTFGNPEAVPVQQPNWNGDTHNGSGDGHSVSIKHEDNDQLVSDSSPTHKLGKNWHSSDEADTKTTTKSPASQCSLETTAHIQELPADECWLLKCPKRSDKSATTPREPIHNWLRAVFDAPNSIFYSSRRNLLTRLEIILASGGPIDAYRFGGSVPSLNQIPSNAQKTTKPPPYIQSNVMNSSRRIASAGSSDSLSMYTPVNTYINDTSSTFGKLSKPKHSLPPQYSASVSQRIDSLTNLSSGTGNLSQSLGGHLSGLLLTSSPGKSGSLDELEKSASRTNIQEIARIQEDNLKAEVAAMAAAAAQSGRNGSHQSLASLGRRSPEGSYSRVPSAPESPHSSNPQLAPTAGHIYHRPTVDLSSTTFASYMIPESVKSQALTAKITQLPQAHVPRVSHTTDSRAHQNSNLQPMNGLTTRHAYSPLPQKPTIPVSATAYRQTTVEPGMNPAPSIEHRNQFGFRSMRRIPGPQPGPRPTAYLPQAPR